MISEVPLILPAVFYFRLILKIVEVIWFSLMIFSSNVYELEHLRRQYYDFSEFCPQIKNCSSLSLFSVRTANYVVFLLKESRKKPWLKKQ